MGLMNKVFCTAFFLFFSVLATSAEKIWFYDNANKAPLITLINSAQKTIDMELYEMNDISVLNALRKAIKRGVVIRVVQEPMPVNPECILFQPRTPDQTAREEKTCPTQRLLMKEILASGGAYVPFNKAELCGDGSLGKKPQSYRWCFQHGKMLLIDAKTPKAVGFISTGNLGPENLCNLITRPSRCNRDFSLVIGEPLVIQAFHKVFESDLKGKPYNLSRIIKPVSHLLTVSPYSTPEMIRFIRSAKKSIVIQNQYLNDPLMNAEIIAASKRGVKVSMMIASFCYFSYPNDTQKKRATETYEAFDAAGVHTRMFTKNILIRDLPGYMHAKTIVVDGIKAWVGSTNGSTNAFQVNREFGVFISTTSEVDKLKSVIRDDFKHPWAISWRDSLRCKDGPPLFMPKPGN